MTRYWARNLGTIQSDDNGIVEVTKADYDVLMDGMSNGREVWMDGSTPKLRRPYYHYWRDAHLYYYDEASDDWLLINPPEPEEPEEPEVPVDPDPEPEEPTEP